jgi:LPS-assembly protein
MAATVDVTPPTRKHLFIQIMRTPSRFCLLLMTLFISTMVAGISQAAGKATPFDLQAADIAFDASVSRVVATGASNAPVVVKGAEGTVTAAKVIYDLTADRLLAQDNVTFTDPSGTVLVVDKLELTGDLKTGTLNQLRLALPGIGPVGGASTGAISGSIFTLQNVVYSPCKTCTGARKPWQIKAEQAVFNQPSGTMTYKNATLDVYGVPVAYVPWFRHPLGTANPQSGLLPPSFGRSESFGNQVSLGGYIWSPTENADYTLKTRLMSERGAQLMAERRQVGTNLTSEIKLSSLRDIGLSKGQGATRSHANAVAQYNFSPNRRLGVNAEVASDDTYLNQFFDRTDPYLASTAFAEDGDEQMFIGALKLPLRPPRKCCRIFRRPAGGS